MKRFWITALILFFSASLVISQTKPSSAPQPPDDKAWLKSKNPPERRQAANHFGLEKRDTSMIPALAELLSDPDVGVRYSAAEAVVGLTPLLFIYRNIRWAY